MRLKKFAVLMLGGLFLFSLTSCDDKKPDNPNASETLAPSLDKSVFEIGYSDKVINLEDSNIYIKVKNDVDKLDLNKIKVKAKNVKFYDSSNNEVSGEVSLKEGFNTFSIKFKLNDNDYTFTLDVDRRLPRRLVEVKPEGVRDTYLVNRDDKITGNLRLIYDDDTTKLIPIEDSMVEGFDYTRIGYQEITLSYGGLSSKYKVDVRDYSYIVDNVKTTYLVGEEFVAPTLVLKFLGESIDVPVTEDMVEGFDTSEVGQVKCTLKYKDYSYIYYIDVLERLLIQEYRTLYELNEPIKLPKIVYKNPDGRYDKLYATMDMITGFDTSSVGDRVMTLTYKDRSVSIEYQVREKIVEFINPKIIYSVGQGFKPFNVHYRFDVEYDDLITIERVSGFDTSTPGEKTVTVHYNGVKKELKINVLSVDDYNLYIYKELMARFNSYRSVIETGLKPEFEAEYKSLYDGFIKTLTNDEINAFMANVMRYNVDAAKVEVLNELMDTCLYNVFTLLSKEDMSGNDPLINLANAYSPELFNNTTDLLFGIGKLFSVEDFEILIKDFNPVIAKIEAKIEGRDVSLGIDELAKKIGLKGFTDEVNSLIKLSTMSENDINLAAKLLKEMLVSIHGIGESNFTEFVKVLVEGNASMSQVISASSYVIFNYLSSINKNLKLEIADYISANITLESLSLSLNREYIKPLLRSLIDYESSFDSFLTHIDESYIDSFIALLGIDLSKPLEKKDLEDLYQVLYKIDWYFSSMLTDDYFLSSLEKVTSSNGLINISTTRLNEAIDTILALDLSGDITSEEVAACYGLILLAFISDEGIQVNSLKDIVVAKGTSVDELISLAEANNKITYLTEDGKENIFTLGKDKIINLDEILNDINTPGIHRIKFNLNGKELFIPYCVYESKELIIDKATIESGMSIIINVDSTNKPVSFSFTSDPTMVYELNQLPNFLNGFGVKYYIESINYLETVMVDCSSYTIELKNTGFGAIKISTKDGFIYIPCQIKTAQ